MERPLDVSAPACGTRAADSVIVHIAAAGEVNLMGDVEIPENAGFLNAKGD